MKCSQPSNVIVALMMPGYIPHRSLVSRARGDLQQGMGLHGLLFTHKVVKTFAPRLQFPCPHPYQSRHLCDGCANLIPSHTGVIPGTARQPPLSSPQISLAKNSVLFLDPPQEKLNTLLESDKQNLFWERRPSETAEDGARLSESKCSQLCRMLDQTGKCLWYAAEGLPVRTSGDRETLTKTVPRDQMKNSH